LLKNSSGRVTKVENIHKDNSFEEGTFGSVRESSVTVSNKERKRDYSLAIKEFKKEGGAQRAFEAYCKLKEAGLKVPPTYRLDEENNRIFMTNFNKDGKAALAASSSNKHVEGLAIKNIPNLDNLKSELEKQCILAAKNGIRLPVDAFFFIVSRKGGSENMDFVIGDLDLIFSDYAKELNLDEQGYIKENISNANEALQLIIEKYVK